MVRKLIHLFLMLLCGGAAAALQIAWTVHQTELPVSSLLPLSFMAVLLSLTSQASWVALACLGAGLAGEGLNTAPLGANLVAAAAAGLVLVNLMRFERLTWIWNGLIRMTLCLGIWSTLLQLGSLLQPLAESAPTDWTTLLTQLLLGAGFWLVLSIHTAGLARLLQIQSRAGTD